MIDAQRSNLKKFPKPKMERNGERFDVEVKKRKVSTGTPGALSSVSRLSMQLLSAMVSGLLMLCGNKIWLNI